VLIVRSDTIEKKKMNRLTEPLLLYKSLENDLVTIVRSNLLGHGLGFFELETPLVFIPHASPSADFNRMSRFVDLRCFQIGEAVLSFLTWYGKSVSAGLCC
jgi:hypothetical protein